MDPSNPPPRATILLVEDDDAQRATLTDILTSSGYHVLPARGASEAHQAGKHHRGPIDLLIADVVMPGVWGPELALDLAVSQPNMKLLYISGYGQDAIGSFDSSTPFLQKPFSAAKLVGKVQEVLGEPG